MNREHRLISLRMLVTVMSILAAFSTIRCSSSNNNNPGPTPPTTTVSIAGIAINPNNATAGGSAQGTVTLSAGAGTSGATVTLSSSNTGVATVPGSVSVAAGATTATFTVTAVGAGTATITATLNGSQTATFTVGAAVNTLVISLASSSVVGGNSVTGTVQLGSPAPSGGASVSLAAVDPVTVPPTVTVPAGAISATFNVATRAVGGSFTVTINASYNGVTASTTLFVTPVAPDVPIARFTVGGPSGSNTCRLSNGGNTFDCTFDGSASTPSSGGTIDRYTWNYSVATNKTETDNAAVHTPSPNCSLLPAATPGVTQLQMTVTLSVHDTAGRDSTTVSNNNVRVLPQNVCGF